jgi:predicted  nucleic acid-binding Zn-ribbon protein
LDKELEKNVQNFQHQLGNLELGTGRCRQEIDVASLVERIRVLEEDVRMRSSRITQLESEASVSSTRICELEAENELLVNELRKQQDELGRLEKRLILAATENSRLKTKSGGRGGNRTADPPVDPEKYRRALMYIDQLQRRLRGE